MTTDPTIQPTPEEKEWCEKLKKLIEEKPKGVDIESIITIKLVRTEKIPEGLRVAERNYYVIVPNHTHQKQKKHRA